MTRARQQLGARAESIVADYLAQQGMEVLARNVRVGRYELDLIARSGPLLVVCEVRSRSSLAFGSPANTIKRNKIAKIRSASARWLAGRQLAVQEVRLDAAAVVFDSAGHHTLHYFPGAL